ncbi:A-kinase anchor protein 17A-like [Uloborus diversus]|uniref:A-kinase anchor protein 17A-like n=1 Tax=Uloborus diversus TaxID=327109 RepID=UPI0024096366|nr:A-kinase anchor protein 17A-like [Uloborus diversus]
MPFQTCSDITEAVALETSLGLYLKPISKIKISVQLPKLKVAGQSISSWQVMEKLKAMIRPDVFRLLKTLKITSAVIKFEGELETKAACERALARVRAAGCLQLNGFSEWLQIRATHAASAGPTRHDWDAFFRDARGVDEMKPGERPDTIYLQELPVRWFAESSKQQKPSERILRKAFSSFGRIRRLEVPQKAKGDELTFGKTSSLQSDLLFEVYIQYEEYVEFATAMDSLRGKKLLFKDPDGKVYFAEIKVDFDRTNYLSDRCIKKRNAETHKVPLISSFTKDKTVENAMKEVMKNASQIQIAKGATKEQHFHSKDEENSMKILLKELLHRAEMAEKKREQENQERMEKERLRELEIEQQKKVEEFKKLEKKRQEMLIKQERILKEKLLRNLKEKKQQKLMEIREKLRRELAGRKVLKSVLVCVSPKHDRKGC